MAPKQTDPQFKLRLTPELKEAIEVAAANNNRSMNAEILARLKETFDTDDAADTEFHSADFYKHLDTVVERTIRMVRDEERKAGLPPLGIDKARDE